MKSNFVSHENEKKSIYEIIIFAIYFKFEATLSYMIVKY